MLKAANKGSVNQSDDKRCAAIVPFLVAPPRIAPQLRAQGHVEARRQKVLPIRKHAAKDRLAVRRDAAARRQRLAAGGAGAAKVLDLLPIWREESRDAGEATSRDEAKARSGGGEARFGGGGKILRAAVPRRVATSPVPATDTEHSEPGGAGVRGRALSGGSTRGARGARAGPRGAEGPGFGLLLRLPKR